MDRQQGCLEPELSNVLVPVRYVEGVRHTSWPQAFTQGPCKRGHSKKGTRPDIMTSTSTCATQKRHEVPCSCPSLALTHHPAPLPLADATMRTTWRALTAPCLDLAAPDVPVPVAGSAAAATGTMSPPRTGCSSPRGRSRCQVFNTPHPPRRAWVLHF